jgi:hypothetical protein
MKLPWVPTETGEMTYFAVAEGFGVAEADEFKGLGPDLTDHL